MPRKAAPKEIELSEISASEAAKRLGMTAQSIGQWTLKPGCPMRRQGTRVYIRWPDFVRWRDAELERKGKRESQQSVDQRRMLAANAEESEVRLARAKIELAKAQESVIDIRDSEALVGKILDRLMAMLRALPMRFPELGAHAQTAIEVEVERMIESLHAFDEDLIEVETADDDDQGDSTEAAP